MLRDERPVCTKEKPLAEMRLKARHPNARFVREVNADHGDELWRCPDCGYQWVKEGSDY